jgi:hypothetical protein
MTPSKSSSWPSTVSRRSGRRGAVRPRGTRRGWGSWASCRRSCRRSPNKITAETTCVTARRVLMEGIRLPTTLLLASARIRCTCFVSASGLSIVSGRLSPSRSRNHSRIRRSWRTDSRRLLFSQVLNRTRFVFPPASAGTGARRRRPREDSKGPRWPVSSRCQLGRELTVPASVEPVG